MREALDGLSSQLNRLDDLTQNLAKRLEPIRQPVPLKKSVGEACTMPALVPLAAEVTSLTVRVASTAAVIERLCEEVEL